MPDQRLWRERNISFGNQVNSYKVKREKENYGDNRTGFPPPHLRTLPRGTIQVLLQNTLSGSLNESVWYSSGICLSICLHPNPGTSDLPDNITHILTTFLKKDQSLLSEIFMYSISSLSWALNLHLELAFGLTYYTCHNF